MTTPHNPDLLNTARLIVAALYYELPGDKGEAYWTNAVASRLSVFRSQCMAKQVSADQLAIRIRAQARRLRDYLELPDQGPHPRLSSLALLEGSLCEIIDAPGPVRQELMNYHQLIMTSLFDQCVNDTLGIDDDYELPCVCGEIDLRVYHTLYQQ